MAGGGGVHPTCLIAHPKAALRLDVQHGEDSLVQYGVAHRLGAVSVGRHLGGGEREGSVSRHRGRCRSSGPSVWRLCVSSVSVQALSMSSAFQIHLSVSFNLTLL